jgi:hypothetical protein
MDQRWQMRETEWQSNDAEKRYNEETELKTLFFNIQYLLQLLYMEHLGIHLSK